MHVPFGVLISEHATFFHDTDGSPAGLAGVVRLSPIEGQIWMLCTPLITTKPHTFVRGARKWLKEVEKDYDLCGILQIPEMMFITNYLSILGLGLFAQFLPDLSKYRTLK